MNRGYWILFVCLWGSLCCAGTDVLVELDSFLSRSAHNALVSLIRSADAAGRSVCQVCESCRKAGIPLTRISCVRRANNISFYKVVCEPPAFCLTTTGGSFVKTGSGLSRCAKSFFDTSVVDTLNHYSFSGGKVTPCVSWLEKQDVVFLNKIMLAWHDSHDITFSLRDPVLSDIEFVLDDRQNIADLWPRLLLFCSSKVRRDHSLVDLRYDGMCVLSKAQKNKKGGAQ